MVALPADQQAFTELITIYVISVRHVKREMRMRETLISAQTIFISYPSYLLALSACKERARLLQDIPIGLTASPLQQLGSQSGAIKGTIESQRSTDPADLNNVHLSSYRYRAVRGIL